MRRFWAWAARRRDDLVTRALTTEPAPRPLPARAAPLDPELHARIRRIVGR